MPAVKTIRKTDNPAVKAAAKKPAVKTAKKVTLDDVWAIIADIGKVHKELEKAHKETEKTLQELNLSRKETEKMLREANLKTEKTLQELNLSRKETEKTLREANLKTEKTLQELNLSHTETEKTLREANLKTEKTLNKAIGGLSNTLGSLVEHIMTPDLPRKFRQFGFTFNRITTVKWADGEGNVYTEIDGLLENGSQAMVVEVKTTLRRGDIDDHVERMGRVRKYADDHGDRREFLGAMAATITDKDTKEYALSKGFFVIEPSGEDVKITKPVSEPKVW